MQGGGKDYFNKGVGLSNNRDKTIQIVVVRKFSGFRVSESIFNDIGVGVFDDVMVSSPEAAVPKLGNVIGFKNDDAPSIENLNFELADVATVIHESVVITIAIGSE